jgi:hypothetical protein
MVGKLIWPRRRLGPFSEIAADKMGYCLASVFDVGEFE